jgi:DNA-directed RNA polymerase I subunit RPA2
VEVLLRETAQLGVRTRAQCLAHLGKHFRAVSLRQPECLHACRARAYGSSLRTQVLDVAAERDDVAVGEQLLRELIFVHLSRPTEKFALLILMLRKLYALASGSCQGDNPDSLLHQEVLLPGHLLQQFFKEHFQDWQVRLKEVLLKEAQDKPSTSFDEAGVVDRAVSKACGYVDIGKRMMYLLSTGNLASRTGLGQTQKSGFTIVAEKLNFLRYLSHFRSVHRGAYFQELRTTSVRHIA